MVQYSCDVCGRIKQEGEEWILGFAAENRGVKAARREIVISPQWDENRAVDWLAVHFCSEEDKDKYTAALFAETPRPLEAQGGVPTRMRVITRKATVSGAPRAKTSAKRGSRVDQKRKRA